MPSGKRKASFAAKIRKRRKTNLKRYKQREDLSAVRNWLVAFAGGTTIEGVPYANVSRYGRAFVGGFPKMEIRSSKALFVISPEEPISEGLVNMSVCVEHVGCIGRIGLGFAPGRVLIEAVKGRKHFGILLKDFSLAVGLPWPNYLIKKFISLARRLGYNEIGLRDPTTLYSYKNPQVTASEPKEAIQQRMRSFYSIIRKKLGFTERRGNYWFKKL